MYCDKYCVWRLCQGQRALGAHWRGTQLREEKKSQGSDVLARNQRPCKIRPDKIVKKRWAQEAVQAKRIQRSEVNTVNS